MNAAAIICILAVLLIAFVLRHVWHGDRERRAERRWRAERALRERGMTSANDADEIEMEIDKDGTVVEFSTKRREREGDSFDPPTPAEQREIDDNARQGKAEYGQEKHYD